LRLDPLLERALTERLDTSREPSRTITSSTWRIRASGVLKRVGPRPRGCSHRDTSLSGVCGERAAADRGRFWPEEVTANVAASARAARRAAVAGGSGGSP